MHVQFSDGVGTVILFPVINGGHVLCSARLARRTIGGSVRSVLALSVPFCSSRMASRWRTFAAGPWTSSPSRLLILSCASNLHNGYLSSQLYNLLDQHLTCSRHIVLSGRHVSSRNRSRHLVSIHDWDLKGDRNSVILSANNSFVKSMFSLATI